MKRTRKGFTLVELLVVIGIIAVLISILLPSLARARQAALTLQCLSNLRTIGQGLAMYADSNKGFYPYGIAQGPDGSDANTTPDYDTYWSSTVAASLSSAGTENAWDGTLANSMAYFRCPEVNVPRGFGWTPGAHYGGHPLVFPTHQLYPDGTGWYQNFGPVNKGNGPHPPELYKAVWMAKGGSEKVIVWDAVIETRDLNVWSGSCQPVSINVDGSMYWWGCYLIADAPAIYQGTWVTPAWLNGGDPVRMDGVFRDKTADGDPETFRARHNGNTACNFLFADGHAETRTIRQTGANSGTSDLTHNNFAVPYPVPGLRKP